MSIYFDEGKDLARYTAVAMKFNTNCNPDNQIGSGMYGVCFNVGSSKAVKITGDDFEVSLAIRLLNSNVESMPSVHKVIPADEDGLWLIEMDLCDHLDESETQELEPIFEEFHEYDEDFGGGTLNSFRSFLEEADYGSSLLYEIEELIELACLETGFNDLDFHLDNLMRLDDRLVLIDQKKTKQSTFDINLVNALLADYKDAARDVTPTLGESINGAEVPLQQKRNSLKPS